MPRQTRLDAPGTIHHRANVARFSGVTTSLVNRYDACSQKQRGHAERAWERRAAGGLGYHGTIHPIGCDLFSPSCHWIEGSSSGPFS